jgi:hypothetical protein
MPASRRGISARCSISSAIRCLRSRQWLSNSAPPSSRRRRAARFASWQRFATEIEGQRLKHPQVPRRHLDNYLLPEFGDRVPAEITPADAARLLAKISKRAPTAANDLLRFMRRVFRFGVRRHLLIFNPVADFDQQDAGGPERKRRRALSQGELEDLPQTSESTATGTATGTRLARLGRSSGGATRIRLLPSTIL